MGNKKERQMVVTYINSFACKSKKDCEKLIFSEDQKHPDTENVVVQSIILFKEKQMRH